LIGYITEVIQLQNSKTQKEEYLVNDDTSTHRERFMYVGVIRNLYLLMFSGGVHEHIYVS